jgi:hypothetical protein
MQRPGWKVLAGGAAAVAVVVALVVVTRGDGDGDLGGGCLPGLVAHLPRDTSVISGTDVDRARAAGVEVDGSADELSQATAEVGLRLDPVTSQQVLTFDAEEGETGFTLDQMRCWLGPQDPSFVAQGSFDGEAVAGSEIGDDGEARVRDDLLAYDPGGDPEALLDPQDDGAAAQEQLTAALAQLERQDVVSFDILSVGDDDADAEAAWVGMGLAHGDDWELLGVWSFADGDRAEAQRDAVVDAIGDGAIDDMVDGDPDDLVQQDGATLWLRAPLTGDVADWTRPIVVFDPAITIGTDLGDD